ncbi:MAG: hypothetical protein R8G66_21650 [Cytophagales bacterium]|nr:hypothetical protein [Cytophagales bacterium]
MTLLLIWIAVLVGLVFLVRFADSFDSFQRKSEKTECPNCSLVAHTKKKGLYTCEECNFIFDVDRKGDAEKYKKSEIYTGLIFGALFLIASYYGALDLVHKYSQNEELEFKHGVLMITISYLAIYMVIRTIKVVKGYKFYKSQELNSKMKVAQKSKI